MKAAMKPDWVIDFQAKNACFSALILLGVYKKILVVALRFCCVHYYMIMKHQWFGNFNEKL